MKAAYPVAPGPCGKDGTGFVVRKWFAIIAPLLVSVYNIKTIEARRG